MIKRGEYAIYNNKEYEAYEIENNKIELTSRDEIDVVENQFKPSFKYGKLQVGIYKKVVSKEDLEMAYRVKIYAKYKENKYQAIGQKEDCYIIPIDRDSKEADELKICGGDKSGLKALINKDKVKLIEKRKSIWGFEIPEEEQWIEV